MSAALISVIREDSDVLEYNIIYYYNMGIRDFYIMLHLDDGTNRSILESLKSRFRESVNIVIFVNDTDSHYHDQDCKVLTDAAQNDGFRWIVATDADELLILKKHATINDFISEYDRHDSMSLIFSWFEYRVTGGDVIGGNPFTQIQHRESKPRQQTKSIGKFNGSMHYVPGAHYVADSPKEITIPPDVAYYAHFSDRNEAQYVGKMKQQAVNWNRRYGKYSHWAEKLNEDDPYGLSKVWRGQVEFARGSGTTIHDPLPPELFTL